MLRDPEGNLVTMFHETGDLRKVKTQLKIGPRKTEAEALKAEAMRVLRKANEQGKVVIEPTERSK